jgi:hypothetical protein
MDNALCVRRFESATNLPDDKGRFLSRRPPLVEDRRKVLAFDILHRYVLDVVAGTKIEYSDNVSVRDLASENQFLLESTGVF